MTEVCVECGTALMYIESAYAPPTYMCPQCGLETSAGSFALPLEDRLLALSTEDQLRIAFDIQHAKKEIGRLGAAPLTRQDIIEILTARRSEEYITRLLEIITIKEATCIVCGKTIKYVTRKPLYCENCQKTRRRKYLRSYQRQRRSRM